MLATRTIGAAGGALSHSDRAWSGWRWWRSASDVSSGASQELRSRVITPSRVEGLEGVGRSDVPVTAVIEEEQESPIGEVHEAALRGTGFCVAGHIWRQPDDDVLLAIR